MYINKPSVTKTEAADRIILLHGTSYSFEQYKSSKPGETPGGGNAIYEPYGDVPPIRV